MPSRTPVYLDHAATTPMRPAAIEAMTAARWAGAAYLLWIGVRILQTPASDLVAGPGGEGVPLGGAWWPAACFVAACCLTSAAAVVLWLRARPATEH